MPNITTYRLVRLFSNRIHFADTKIKNKLIDYINAWEIERETKKTIINTIENVNINYNELTELVNNKDMVLLTTNKKHQKRTDLFLQLNSWTKLLAIVSVELNTSLFSKDIEDLHNYIYAYVSLKQIKIARKLYKLEAEIRRRKL